MGTLEYAKYVRTMFEMFMILRPLSRKNDKYHEDFWDTNDMPYKEDIICKAIKGIIALVTIEELQQKFGDDYHTIPTEQWTGMLGTVQATYYSRCAARESYKTGNKKKNYEQPNDADTTSQLRHRVPHKKHKPNPGKGKQQKNARHCDTQHYYVLFKKGGYPKRRYKSGSSEQLNIFDYSNTKKDQGGSMSKRGGAAKHFHKTEEKMHKQMKSLKKQNKMMFKLDKKTITRHDLNKIKR